MIRLKKQHQLPGRKAESIFIYAGNKLWWNVFPALESPTFCPTFTTVRFVKNMEGKTLKRETQILKNEEAASLVHGKSWNSIVFVVFELSHLQSGNVKILMNVFFELQPRGSFWH